MGKNTRLQQGLLLGPHTPTLKGLAQPEAGSLPDWACLQLGEESGEQPHLARGMTVWWPVLLLMSRGPALHLHLGLFINLLDFITPRESRQVGDLLTALHRGGG